MNPILTIPLTTAAGAIIGTIVGVLLMRRQLRPPVTEAQHTELKSKLHRSELSLTAANTNIENLEKQIALRDQTILQSVDESKQQQQQLDIALKAAQAEAVRSAAVELRMKELGSQADILTEQCAKLSANGREQLKQLAEKTAQVEALHSELDSGKRSARELGEQVMHLTAELDELRSFKEQEARYRSSLEAQLIAHQEQTGQLSARVAELENERVRLEVQLEGERQSAAKGMELLLMAQQKFAGVFKPGAPDGQNGNGAGKNGKSPEPEVEVEMAEEIAVTAESCPAPRKLYQR